LKINTTRGKLNYFPTRKFSLPVDTALVLKNGTVPPEYADSVLTDIRWNYDGHVVMKNGLAVFNLLSELNWKRPVYFASTTGDDAYLNLLDYLQLEGLAYRLVPYRCHSIDQETGRVNTTIMYENMMNRFAYGNMNCDGIYLDETNMRLTNTFRKLFSRLATALQYEGKPDKALQVCDKCIEVMPDNTVPYNYMLLPIIKVYYQCGQKEKANQIVTRLGDYCEQELRYFNQFKGTQAVYISMEKNDALDLLKKLTDISKTYNQSALEKQLNTVFEKYNTAKN